MEQKDGVATFRAKSRAAWRTWLEEYHGKESAVWLVIYKKSSGVPSVHYPEAVDEALCFGWIDSKPNKRDEQSYYQYFSPRHPKSNWSRVNKEKIRRLTAENRMAPAGQAVVALAKEAGTWNALKDVDNLVVPDDLQEAFDRDPTAYQHWQGFPPSVRRGILEWIFNAKRPETRRQRIEKTVQLAAQNIRANF